MTARITPRLLEETPAWYSYAACRHPDIDPDIFFPTRGCTPTQINVAKRICYGCPARDECLAYAMSNRESFGIWGGTSERERRAIRAANRRNRGLLQVLESA
jgi:WhiB family redox-sensing transcriptional regulator